jgi:hypothetical protein
MNPVGVAFDPLAPLGRFLPENAKFCFRIQRLCLRGYAGELYPRVLVR